MKKVFYGLLALGLALLLRSYDFKSLGANLLALDGSVLLVLILLQLVTIGALSLQWLLVVRKAQEDQGFWPVFLMNARGNIADGLTPGVKLGGELARALNLKKLGLGLEEALSLVALQKSLSISSFLLIYIGSGLLALAGGDRGGQVFIRGLVFSLSLLGIFLDLLLRGPASLLGRLVSRLGLKASRREGLEKFLASFRQALDFYRSQRGTFYAELGLALGIWSLYGIKMLILSRALAINLRPSLVFSLTYTSYLLGMIPLLPGSIGSFEAGIVNLLLLKNIARESSLALALIFRFITFWLEFLLSLIFLAGDRLVKVFRKDDKDDKIPI